MRCGRDGIKRATRLPGSGWWRGRSLVGSTAIVVVGVLGVAWAWPETAAGRGVEGSGVGVAEGSGVVAEAGSGADLDVLLARAAAASRGWDRAAAYVEAQVAPIERVLLRYRDDPALARRIAVAVVREANRAGLEPRVLLAVLLVEDPELKPSARSTVGAVGLMQVMPLHRGKWPACSGSLEDVDANICYGAQIFAAEYRRTGDPDRALLAYNGCVKGVNTPDCHGYPTQVYARAGRASVLAWLKGP